MAQNKIDEIKRLLNQLESLLADNIFLQEIKIYRCAFKRLKVRFRNNQFISSVKQLVTSIRKLQVEFRPELFQSYNNRIVNAKSEKKQIRDTVMLLKTICEFITFLDTIFEKTIFIYRNTQPHMKIGHLTHHLIVIRASISRLRICFKAMLVYASDIFMEITEQFNKKGPMDREDVINIMTKHDCKPRARCSIDVTEPHNIPDDCGEIGPIIDRSTMKPISN